MIAHGRRRAGARSRVRTGGPERRGGACRTERIVVPVAWAILLFGVAPGFGSGGAGATTEGPGAGSGVLAPAADDMTLAELADLVAYLTSLRDQECQH